GLNAQNSDSIFVYGGSSGNNAVDFWLQPGGVYHLYGVRGETAGRVLTMGGTSAWTSCNLFHCEITGITAAHNIAIHSSPQLVMTGCFTSGRVVADPSNRASLEMVNCVTRDNVPFRILNIASSRRLRYRVAGCYQVDTSNVMLTLFDDEEGIATAFQRTPAR